MCWWCHLSSIWDIILNRVNDITYACLQTVPACFCIYVIDAGDSNEIMKRIKRDIEKSIEKGIISRIYLKNFVTYDNVVIRPGRNLNLIIGPNGTGKSTIVCAIVLGLGGKPKVIGRALHVGEYVKSGCKEAKIEISLTHVHNDTVVTRIFTTENHTSWMIDGKTVSLKEVLALTESLNIQVDNLCQFLPQDKVQDFSKMNPQELLENTERSVGDPVLFEYHTKLINCRTKFQELETQVTNKRSLLENQTQKYEGLKEIVSSIKERKAIKKKIMSLKQKKAWILYDIMRNDLLKAKKGRDAAAVKMKSLDEKLKPMNDTIQKLQSDIKLLQQSSNEHNNQVYTKTSKTKRLLDEIRMKEDNIKEIESMCEQRIQAEQNRDQEIALNQQQKSKLENDLQLIIDEVGSEETLLEEQKRISLLIENQRRDLNELMNQSSVLKQQEELIKREIGVQKTELQAARDVDAKRLELLRRRSHDAYEGVLWLRKNTDKFRAKVHEPMLLTINVKSAEYSKYLENTIPVRDLIAFVCEDKQDMNLLLKCLRDQQKLQVNAVHSDPNKNVSMRSRIPIENIKQFGFRHYLSSLIDTPATIMKYLITMYRLNDIPVGSNAVEDNVDRIPRSLTRFYSQNKIFSVSLSKYTGDKCTRISNIHGNGILSVILDTSKLHGIAEKLEGLNEKLEFVLRDIEQSNKKLYEKNEEIEKKRTEKNQSQNNIQQIRTVKSRIQITTNKIEDLQSNRVTIPEIRALYNVEIQTVLKTQLEEYKKYNIFLNECFKSISIYEQIKLELKLLQRTLIIKQSESQELRDKYIFAEQTFKRLDADLQPIRAELKKMFEEALELTGGIGPQDERFQSLNKIFAKLPASIDKIDDELKVAQAKVFCLGKNADSENILRDYETTKADVEMLKQEIDTKMTELRVVTEETDTIRDKWLPPLQELVERININFSLYFSTIKCAGEVSLTHGENLMDFKLYGLKIKVKFRDADELQELTRHHQSGGERAVTTAIYMIALQELSRVPFRCVDEINQGMDAINERRIFDLIVKITGKPDSSQYFLLTPKLLPGLQYAETVTVHCVFNGPFMISHTEFETGRHCEQINGTIEEENSDGS